VTPASTDHKQPGRIDEEIFFVAHPSIGQSRDDIGANDLADLVLVDPVGMLDRDDHLGGPHRPAALILQGHLAFGIGTEEWSLAGVPCFR
jgi:hypothetical protein